MKSFKTNVEIYAKENHMTLKRISELSDISFATLNSFLYGNTKDCKLSTAVKLAKAFGISIDELTGAGTISETTKSAFNLVRNFPERYRCLIRWNIEYAQKILTEDKRKKIISVYFCDNQNNNTSVNNRECIYTDISACDNEIKSKVFMGIKMNTEDYMPKYIPGDIILIANDRTGRRYEDYVIVYYEKIYIVKEKRVSGKTVYYSIANPGIVIDEDEIDIKIGYVAGVFYDENEG